MRTYLFFSFVFMLLSFTQGYSQYIFPEEYKQCNTDHFSLESDSVTVKVKEEELIRILYTNIDSKIKNKISGTLFLQIIVDTTGRSCLLSLKNDTNIRIAKLNLKEVIDSELIWDKPKEKVSALLAVQYYSQGIKIKRLGINVKRGPHELKN